MSLVLMPLVILALFITPSSSLGLKCFRCKSQQTADCDIPINKNSTDKFFQTCTDATVCEVKIWKEEGWFIIYFPLFTDLFKSTKYIDFLGAMVHVIVSIWPRPLLAVVGRASCALRPNFHCANFLRTYCKPRFAARFANIGSRDKFAASLRQVCDFVADFSVHGQVCSTLLQSHLDMSR